MDQRGRRVEREDRHAVRRMNKIRRHLPNDSGSQTTGIPFTASFATSFFAPRRPT